MANKKKASPEVPVVETAPAEPELNEQEIDTTAETAPAAEEPTAEQPKQETPSCPFEATVTVALAVLRKNIGPGTAAMLKPVATLKQGAKVTVTEIHGSDARLANGLWIALEYITK